MNDLVSFYPNIPHESVPSRSETITSKCVAWGTPPKFNFEPKDHVDLGAALGILDLERARRSPPFRDFNGAGARLERALINFMLDVQTREHGYPETLPPFIVNRAALFGTAQLPSLKRIFSNFRTIANFI